MFFEKIAEGTPTEQVVHQDDPTSILLIPFYAGGQIHWKSKGPTRFVLHYRQPFWLHNLQVDEHFKHGYFLSLS